MGSGTTITGFVTKGKNDPIVKQANSGSYFIAFSVLEYRENRNAKANKPIETYHRVVCYAKKSILENDILPNILVGKQINIFGAYVDYTTFKRPNGSSDKLTEIVVSYPQGSIEFPYSEAFSHMENVS